jgi:alpha-ketoglutarate-dependent taurine dioxygenase
MRAATFLNLLVALLCLLIDFCGAADAETVEVDVEGMNAQTRIIVRPVEGESFGGEILGMDVETINHADFNIVKNALNVFKVIAIRNQSALTVEGQRKFTERFGPLHVHLESASHLPGYTDVNVVSNIKDANGSYIGLYGKHVENFHSDLSWYFYRHYSDIYIKTRLFL